MSNPLVRHSPYLILAVGFCCSLLLAAEVDLVAVAAPVAGPRHRRIELEELMALSGLFSLILAAVALLKTHLATRARRRTEAESAAFVDPLTGLSNRRRFLELLGNKLDNLTAGRRCALLLLDLDKFKGVNDRFGHATGDALLIEVARRLTTLVRKPANAGRLGGDEFALILEGTEAELFGARILLCRLLAELGKPFVYGGTTLWPSGSVGLAFPSRSCATVAELLEAAEVDMHSKREGKVRSAA